MGRSARFKLHFRRGWTGRVCGVGSVQPWEEAEVGLTEWGGGLGTIGEHSGSGKERMKGETLLLEN